MFQGKTDKDWEYYGKTNPYFGVVTWDKFKAENLDEDAKKDFFQTGNSYVQSTVDVIEQNIRPNFRPQRTLDFGCGVGRLTIPISRVSESVVGVDVSQSMLEEGRSNCQELGITNINFVQGDDELSKVTGKFDFIHSYIVFQHIPRERGETIFVRLLDLLEEEGIGALHFTYQHDSNWLNSLKYNVYQFLPFLWSLKNRLRGLTPRPMMQMNLYNLNVIFQLLQTHNCHNPVIRFTHHSGRTAGVIIYFEKKKLAMF